MFPIGVNEGKSVFNAYNKMDVDLVVSVCHKIKKLDVLDGVKVRYIFGMCNPLTRVGVWVVVYHTGVAVASNLNTCLL